MDELSAVYYVIHDEGSMSLFVKCPLYPLCTLWAHLISAAAKNRDREENILDALIHKTYAKLLVAWKQKGCKHMCISYVQKICISTAVMHLVFPIYFCFAIIPNNPFGAVIQLPSARLPLNIHLISFYILPPSVLFMQFCFCPILLVFQLCPIKFFYTPAIVQFCLSFSCVLLSFFIPSANEIQGGIQESHCLSVCLSVCLCRFLSGP